MRLFADHCVPGLIIKRLEEAGHEVLKLRDYLPQDAPDPVVIKHAQERKAVLLTLNGDFSDIVAYPPSEYKGIISIQLKNRPSSIPTIMDRLLSYMAEYADQKGYEGVLLLVEPHRIRIRR